MAESASAAYERYRTDPVCFIEECFLMRPESGGALVPYELWPIQKRFLNDLVLRSTSGPVWAICLKARRLGITSATQALCFSRLVLTPNYLGALLTQLKTPGRNILDYAGFYMAGISENLFSLFRCEAVCAHDDLRCVFVEKTKDSWHFRWGSRLQVFTAETQEMSRGLGLQFLHLSEAAYYGSSEERLISAILPTVSKDTAATNVFVIAESTGSGASGWFYDTYMIAKEAIEARKESRSVSTRWQPYFYPWFEDSRYRRPDLLENGKLPPDPRFADEEDYLKRVFCLGDDQLAWRRATIEDEFSGNHELFRREYPATDKEAFLVPSRGVFPSEVLFEMRARAEGLPRLGFVERRLGGLLTFTESRSGLYRVVEEPRPGVDYLIGADPALGMVDTEFTRAGDYSAAVVIRRDGAKLRQVAMLRTRADVESFATDVMKLAQFYNNAWICPERNSGVGRHMIRVLRRSGYQRLWRNKDMRRLGITIDEAYGFQTDATSKQMLISDTQAALQSGTLEINDVVIIDELLDYTRLEGRSRERYGPSSAAGHDDAAMALMIAVTAYTDNPPHGGDLGDEVEDFEDKLEEAYRIFARAGFR